MSRGSASALVAAAILAVVSLALLWMRGGERPRRGRDRDHGTAASGAAPRAGQGDGDRRALGVGARPVEARPELEVSGRVEDPDGEPITEGRVALWCLPAGERHSAPLPGGALELDDAGEFRGPGCSGTICAEFVHPAMIQRGSWVLEPGRPARLVADALERRGGVVVDRSGAPVAGARLLVRPPPGEEDPTALPPFTSRSTVADAEGNFSLARVERSPCDPCREASGRCVVGGEREVPTYPTMILVARAPGYRGGELLVDLDADEAWRIELGDPAAPITGRLVDDAGEAYPRAKILARSAPRPYEVHTAAVDGDAFELAELGDGPYDLRAIQDGIELAAQAGVEAGEEVELRGGLPAAGVELRLRILEGDGEGAPLAGAEVDGGPFVAAKADGDGVVAATKVLPGPYSLRIWPPGRGPESHRVVVNDGEAEVELELRVGARP